MRAILKLDWSANYLLDEIVIGSGSKSLVLDTIFQVRVGFCTKNVRFSLGFG